MRNGCNRLAQRQSFSRWRPELCIRIEAARQSPERSEGSRRVLGAACLRGKPAASEPLAQLGFVLPSNPSTTLRICHAHLLDQQTRLHHPPRRINWRIPAQRLPSAAGGNLLPKQAEFIPSRQDGMLGESGYDTAQHPDLLVRDFLASGDSSYWDVTVASAWSLNPSAFVTLRIVSKPGTLSPDRAL